MKILAEGEDQVLPAPLDAHERTADERFDRRIDGLEDARVIRPRSGDRPPENPTLERLAHHFELREFGHREPPRRL